MERDISSTKFSFGSPIPNFKLPAVDGSSFSSRELATAKASLIVFSCNHCPYVQGSDKHLIDAVEEFNPKGLVTVAISSNDAAKYPDDSFEKMKEKSRRLNLSFPYLYDESQEVAKLFDAACTPECYLFDDQQKLVWHGTINDNPRDPSQATKFYLIEALRQLFSGKNPDPKFVHPIGCSIKWR